VGHFHRRGAGSLNRQEDSMDERTTRRLFIGNTVAGAVASGLTRPERRASSANGGGRPALLGGTPVRTQKFPSWPKIAANDEKSWSDVLHAGKWCRLDGKFVKGFEEQWASALGAKYCLGTASGTTALITSLNALDVAPGDEVIVPPYTFVATINVVLLQHALPVFVDTDRDTFQIDAKKIEAAITPRTRAVIPVHLGGSPADMDAILEVADKHKLPVLEDACQAHLAEWRNRKVSTLGQLGCFSFQASKNLNSGEGGAIITNSRELIETCRSFHNNGRPTSDSSFGYVRNGANYRMTEFQGALLQEQFTRLEAQSRVREQNAQYLTRQLADIPGIKPARMYEGCTRNAYHLYMFRYESGEFSDLSRNRFIKALNAEGVPCSPGYSPLNKEPSIEASLRSRAFQKIYSEKELSEYRDRIHCPENDRLCEEAVWLVQTMLLGSRQDMDQIVEAIHKIRKNAGDLVKERVSGA
jgi:perosamine synthetase